MDLWESASTEDANEKDRECSTHTDCSSPLRPNGQERLRKWLQQMEICSEPSDYASLKKIYIQQRDAALSRLLWVCESQVEDPLSLRSATSFEQETHTLIELDLPRTVLLREGKTIAHKELFDVLFTWAHLHQDLGYRQGMNELAAFCSYVVREGLPEPEEPGLHASLTYALFSRLLAEGLQSYYQFKEGPKQLPLNRKILHIYRKLLRATDPELYQHLEMARLEPSVCFVRWLRLLFLRETSEAAALQLWDFYVQNLKVKWSVAIGDALVAIDAIDVISISLLISEREKLMRVESDYGVVEVLQAIKCEDFSPFKDICDKVIGSLNRKYDAQQPSDIGCTV